MATSGSKVPATLQYPQETTTIDDLPRPKLTKPIFNAPFTVGSTLDKEGIGADRRGVQGNVPEWVLQRVDDVIMEHFWKVQNVMDKITSRLDDHAEEQAILRAKVDQALTQVTSLMQAQTVEWNNTRERDRDMKTIKEMVFGRNAQLESVHMGETLRRLEEDMRVLKKRVDESRGRVHIGGAGGYANAPPGQVPGSGNPQNFNFRKGSTSSMTFHGIDTPTPAPYKEDGAATPLRDREGAAPMEGVMRLLAERLMKLTSKVRRQEIKLKLFALDLHAMPADDRQDIQQKVRREEQQLEKEEMFQDHDDRPLAVFQRLMEPSPI